MTANATTENIIRRRMHGLYLSRRCADLETLARELLGLHSWFSRNVSFSAFIRDTEIRGWKTKLTKTWLYRGTLHGVMHDDLPKLLAISAGEQKDCCFSCLVKEYSVRKIDDIATVIISLMEDGVYSRAEFRRIFAERYEPKIIDRLFSSWGNVVRLSVSYKLRFLFIGNFLLGNLVT